MSWLLHKVLGEVLFGFVERAVGAHSTGTKVAVRFATMALVGGTMLAVYGTVQDGPLWLGVLGLVLGLGALYGLVKLRHLGRGTHS